MSRKLWWWLRRSAKDLLCRIGLGSLLIEYCEDCGIRQTLYWWSPDDLWSQLTGRTPVKGDNMPGLLCPKCFDARARKRGLSLRWHPEVEVL